MVHIEFVIKRLKWPHDSQCETQPHASLIEWWQVWLLICYVILICQGVIKQCHYWVN